MYQRFGNTPSAKALKNYQNSEWSKDFVEACSRWKRLIMVNSMQANEAPQERMNAAWRLHKRGCEPRRGSVMVKSIDATTTDRLRRSPLYLDLSPSCARKRACTICRFQRLKNPHFRLFQCSRLWHVSLQTVMYQRIGNMPKACPYVMMRFLRYDAIFTNRCKIYFRLFRWFGK